MKKDVFLGVRLKLCFSMIAFIAVMLAVLIGSFNFYLDSSNLQSANYFMEEVLANEGKRHIPNPDGPPPPERSRLEKGQKFRSVMPKEMKNCQSKVNLFFEHIFQFRPVLFGFRDFYSAKVDNRGVLIAIINPFAESDLNDDAIVLLKEIFKKQMDSVNYGKIGTYCYATQKTEYGFLVVLLDRRTELSMEKQFGLASIFFSLIFMAVAFVSTWLYTSLSIRPVREAFIKQKQFVADASHELKTPIAVISANIDVLEQDIKENKWLEYIKAENSRMGNLVKDLLYLAKSDAGRQTLDIIPFDITDAVACALLPFESVAFEQGKNLNINLPKSEIFVNGDEGKIKQVAIILLDNALKNSEKGAKIDVSLVKDGSKCLLKVYNTGHGIAAKDIDKIFNRFYRADYSRARTTGGYGLGLTIAQNIAVAHHGRVTVQSEEGKYAEFTLTIPVDLKKS